MRYLLASFLVAGTASFCWAANSSDFISAYAEKFCEKKADSADLEKLARDVVKSGNAQAAAYTSDNYRGVLEKELIEFQSDEKCTEVVFEELKLRFFLD